MKSLLVKVIVGMLVLLSVTGCASSQAQPTGQAVVPVTGFNTPYFGTVVSTPNVQNFDQLVREAETYGLNASLVGPIQQPFFSQAGEIILINGQQVQVFQFPSANEQKQAVGQIPRKGTPVAGTPVVQTEPLRVWSGGKLIALYSGQNPQVISFLNAVFGQPRP